MPTLRTSVRTEDGAALRHGVRRNASAILDISVPLRSGQFWLAISFILFVGLAFRLPTLARSLWLDEAYSAWFAALPLRTLWTEVPSYEVHPPFYYSLLKGWIALFGTTEVALRGLSVAASLVTIVIVACAGKTLRAGATGDHVSLLGALFLAIDAGNIGYAQQARPYAIETMTASLAVLCSLALLRTIRDQSGLRALLPAMIGLAVGAGLTLWLHNTGLFIAYGIWVGLAAALYFVRGNRLNQLLAIALPGIAALLIWSPCLPIFLHQSTAVNGSDFWVTFDTREIWNAWYLIAGGRGAFVLVTAFAMLGLWVVWQAEKAFATLLAAILLLPLGTILAIGYFIRPIFIGRLFEWMAPTVLCLAAAGIVMGLKLPKARLVAVLAIILSCLASIRSYYTTPTEDWRGVIASIEANMKPGDLIVASPNEITLPFRYYAAHLAASSDILFVPSPFPALNLPRRYIAGLGAPEIVEVDRALVRDAIKGRSRVWLVERRADLYDPHGLVRAEILTAHTLRQTFEDIDTSVSLFE